MSKIKYILPLAILILAAWGLSGSTSLSSEKLSSKGEAVDTDSDGLADKEEAEVGTDPKNADTDGDGFMDGSEVKSGYDPKVAAPADREVETPQALTGIGSSNFQRNYTNEVSSLVDELVARYQLFSISYDSLSDENKAEIEAEVEDFTDSMLKDSGLDFNYSISEDEIVLDEEEKVDIDGYLEKVKVILIKHKLLKEDQKIEDSMNAIITELMNMSQSDIEWDRIKALKQDVTVSYNEVAKIPVNPELKDIHIGMLKVLKDFNIILTNMDETDYFRAFLAAGRAEKIKEDINKFSKTIEDHLNE